MRLPRRKWIVESRPASWIGDCEWQKSLGPYFRKAMADDMMRRMRLFAPTNLVDIRVRNTDEDLSS